MSNSILYYPTIEFQQSDYQWLWGASLLWDKIYRIVPPGYNLSEPENIRILCETNEIGKPLSPEKYVEDVGKEFSVFMDEYGRNAAALEGVRNDQYHQSVRIHHTKIDQNLKEQLLYNSKIFESDDEWIQFDPEITNFYMTYLANHMAKENNLSLYTHSRELWATSTYFLSEGSLQADCLIHDDCIEQSSKALISMMVTDIFPENVLLIRPDEILHFREKRKDERAQFITALNDFREKLSKATAPEILKEIIHDEIKLVESAKTDYKRSMDILKVVSSYGGMLAATLEVGANALAYLPFPQTAKPIMEFTGVGLAVISGLAKRKIDSRPNNPYSYLTSINKEFSSYHSMETNSLLSRNAYSLYRDIEEFIND